MKISHYLTVTALVLTVAQSALAAGKHGKMSLVFEPDMLNADLTYFENVTGTARQTFGNSKYYKVDGCEVRADISGGKINSLHVTVSPKCTFDLNKFLPNYSGRFPAPHVMTFGQFDALTGSSGRYMADCLIACGNATDPIVFEYWSGSRADGQLEVMLEVVQAGDAAQKAQTWEDAMMKGEGALWVGDTKFNCARTKYDAVARKEFRNVRVTGISIGYGIETPRC